MSEWNSDLYLKFKQQRTQPAFDLAKRVEKYHPFSVADLGCGPGNSTAVVKAVFPDARFWGPFRARRGFRAPMRHETPWVHGFRGTEPSGCAGIGPKPMHPEERNHTSRGFRFSSRHETPWMHGKRA